MTATRTTLPSLWRKKPVTIEAAHIADSSPAALAGWLDSCGYPPLIGPDDTRDRGRWADPADGTLVIRTLEGDMHAGPDDWIIRGVHGELYPCKPDIFDATYEPAPEERHPMTGSPLTDTARYAIDRLTRILGQPPTSTWHGPHASSVRIIAPTLHIWILDDREKNTLIIDALPPGSDWSITYAHISPPTRDGVDRLIADLPDLS